MLSYRLYQQADMKSEYKKVIEDKDVRKIFSLLDTLIYKRNPPFKLLLIEHNENKNQDSPIFFYGRSMRQMQTQKEEAYERFKERQLERDYKESVQDIGIVPVYPLQKKLKKK